MLVLVGSDHFHQLWLDNMPQFLVGKAPFYDANWYNEEREFGLPRMFFKGSENLSSHILRSGLDAGFDLAFSNELRIDHSVTCPMITLRPECDLPIVPIYTNIFAPPLPQPKRYVQLGQMIREVVESWPSDLRVAIIGTGHLSLELGGPRQFGPHGPDPEFDRKAVEWIASGDIEKALGEVSLESLWEPGNATHGFLDFMLMMGVAGAGEKADYVDTLDLFHTMEAYFTWYPKGAGRLMSKYLLNKFLYTVDRDPELVERYREDPRGTVEWWEAERANVILNVLTGEKSHLAQVRRRRARGAGHARLPEAVRARRAPVPDADPVHRHVRARLRGTARLPARVRPAALPLHDALPRHHHLTRHPRRRRVPASRGRPPSA